MLDINKVVTDMLNEQRKIMIVGFDDELNEEGHPRGCDCVDCAGDFSGASEDDEWGGR